MKAFRLLIAPVVISVCCGTARANLTIDSIGTIFDGNSWSVPVTLGGSGFDLLIVEATGATFEAPSGISLSNPAGWTDTYVSPALVTASGPANASGFNVVLTFDDPQPTTATVLFSAFLPGSNTAAGSVLMELQGNEFVASFGSFSTSQTRSGLAAVPVPGAVFLGMMGFGLVGLARKRLR